MKIPIFLAVSLTLVAASAVWKSQSNSQRVQQNQALNQKEREDPTALRARLKKAKPNGNNEVIFPAPEPILADIGSLDEALANYSVVLAQLVNSTSLQVDARNIMTYHKFRVLETLSQKHLPMAGVPEKLPAELSPLKTNEIYVLEGGGTVLIDGVKVTQKAAYEYAKSRKYLLFISKNSPETIAMVSLGKYGIFRVKEDDDDTVEAIAEEISPLKRDLDQRHANKISTLRAVAKRNN
jgi:hypothetical protein